MMQEEQAGLVVEHVIVERGDLDAIRTQRLKHRVDLGRSQDEVARDCGP
jgi:hypothetical protein